MTRLEDHIERWSRDHTDKDCPHCKGTGLIVTVERSGRATFKSVCPICYDRFNKEERDTNVHS